jgi:predicted PurR-regulated permease PerM
MERERNRKFTFDRVVRLVATLILVVLVVALLNHLSGVLLPFAVAVILAYLMNPLVEAIERKVRYRTLAVALALVSVLIVVSAVVAVVVPLISAEIGHTGKVLSSLLGESETAKRAGEILPAGAWERIREFLSRYEIQELFQPEHLAQIARAAGEKILPEAWGLFTGAVSFLLWVLGLSTILLYLVFLLADYRKLRDGWPDLLPSSWRGPIVSLAEDFLDAMRRYFRAQAGVAALTGLMLAAGFGLIGLPMGILLGLFMGVLNMVPYLQVIGLIPAVFFAFVRSAETGQSFWLVLGLTLGVFTVAQVIQDAVIVPRIMGKMSGLSPAIILLSLAVWGKLLGILGLLIAIPMTCLLLAYYRRLLAAAETRGELTAPHQTSS